MRTIVAMLIAIMIVPLLLVGASTTGAGDSVDCCSEPLFNATSQRVPGGLDWYFVLVFGDNRPENTRSASLPPAFHDIMRDAAALRPYAVIGTGDHVGEGLDAQYRVLWRALSGLENVLLVPGNHDLLATGSGERWEHYVGPRYWCWRGIPGWGVAGVDTFDRNLNRFKTMAETVIGECAEAGNIILVTHYPLEPRVGHNIDQAPNGYYKARILRDLIGEHNVSIVIQGHWHGYAEKRDNGTLYIITGGAGAPLYSLEAARTDADYYRTHVNHYLILVLEPSGSYKILPVYTGKGSVRVEKPSPWEAHVYQDRYLINGSPASLPVRLTLQRGSLNVTVQFMAPHASWVNISLLPRGGLAVTGSPGMLEAFYTSNGSLLEESRNVSAATLGGAGVSPEQAPGATSSNTQAAPAGSHSITGTGGSQSGSARRTVASIETVLAVAVILSLVALKKFL